jgi:hypothetical protein
MYAVEPACARIARVVRAGNTMKHCDHVAEYGVVTAPFAAPVIA